MLKFPRRSFILISGATLGSRANPATAQDEFYVFLDGVRAEARQNGITSIAVQQALSGLRPIIRVLELDRRQPEGIVAWEVFRDRTVSQQRIENGRRLAAANTALLSSLEARFRVPSRIILAIWGVETNYGTNTGGFSVIEALATLAWDGRRSSYFRAELMAALRILDAGHIPPGRMRGSWAGAMGQPQFMPTSFEQMAVDADGDGRKDIWDSRADTLGSIANYLSRNGWRGGEHWGKEIMLPLNFDTSLAGRENTRPLRDWVRMGLVMMDGTAPVSPGASGAVLMPGLRTGSRQAFLVFENFNVIRRYNSSDFYALTVGSLSDRM